MRDIRVYVALGIVLLFMGTAFQPAVNGELPDIARTEKTTAGPRADVPAPIRNMAELASKLLNLTTNLTDSDADGLPDNVELVLGTDPKLKDSDFDTLSDNYEVFNGLDPNNPDSNGDGMPDPNEVNNVSSDLDGDGVPNAWDWDNDNDGVYDDMDYSPFTKTVVSDSFRLSLNISEHPSFIKFQFKPKDENHLRLILQEWDWPDDTTGEFVDLDKSKNDLSTYPQLEFKANILPNYEDVAGYGISITNGVAYIPIMPVVQYGRIVAFNAIMFYPQSLTPRNISASIDLAWKVLGKSDIIAKALKSVSISKYVSADESGRVSANASSVGEDETFAWVVPDSGCVALKASNGMYLTVNDDRTVTASASQLTQKEYFKAVPLIFSNKVALRASNDLLLCAKANGSLYADGTNLMNASTQFERVSAGYRYDLVQLASYTDDFLITGCLVEEDFGTTAGVFHSSDKKDAVNANLVLSYEFLRNATQGMDTMPGLLKSKYNLTIESNISDFNTYDDAFAAIASAMPRDALEKLPKGACLPVIAAMEDRGRGMDLSEMASGGFIKGNSLTAKCTAKDVIRTRLLKTTWYNVTTHDTLQVNDVVSEFAHWNTTEAAKVNLIALAMAWTAGETRIAGIGNINTDFSSELNNATVSPWILNAIILGADVLGESLEMLDKYLFMMADKIKGQMIDEIEDFLFYEPGSHPQSCAKVIQNGVKSISKIKRVLGVMEKIGTGIEWIGFLVDAVMLGFTIYAIFNTFGNTPTGWITAIIYGALMLWWLGFLVGLAIAGGPPGMLLALIIGLIDFGLGWLVGGSSFVEWVVCKIIDLLNKYCHKYKIRSNVDLGFIKASTSINDTDSNGLDAGDVMSHSAQFYSNVTVTKDGNTKDRDQSYIIPRFSVSVPPETNSTVFTYATEICTTKTEKSKTTVNETGISVTFGKGMVNFPVAINLNLDYNMFYDDCWFKIIKDRCNMSGSNSSSWSALYFDVMPNNITDFVNWTAIKSNDKDGDGLNDTQENRTYAWKWDSDGDELGDKYEMDIGSDPMKADTDGDGLNDLTELQMETNLSVKDTDGDGLSDYDEIAGAVISFNFTGSQLNYSVKSDPKLNDTDGDGVVDPREYDCQLNPRSQYTDGDGYKDMLGDHGNSTIKFDRIISTPFNGFTRTLVLSPDGHLWGYQWANIPPVNFSMVKYNTNGTIEGIWTVDNNISDMGFDCRGSLYVLHRYPTEIIKYDSWFNQISNWSVAVCNTLVIDSNAGIIYVTGYYCYTLYKYNLHNGSFIGTMKGPDPAGWHLQHMDVDSEGNLMIPYNSSIYIYNRNGTLTTRFGKWGQTNPGEFDMESAVRRCSDGDILVADCYNNRLQKFSPYGVWRTTYGPIADMWASDFFSMPDTLATDDNYIYLRGGGMGSNSNILKLLYKTDVVKVNQTINFTETDGDGLTDRNETAGWNVTVTNMSSSAPYTYHVTSDQNMTDTDGDGLSDEDEFLSGTDPRKVDTDEDGVSDNDEGKLGTNRTDWDTDRDGLDDCMEPVYGSDPKRKDTDADGVNDSQELRKGSHPNDADSDYDGLDDLSESNLGSNLTDPDSDDDFLFDKSEKDKGTDPNKGDTDDDGLGDGYETLYGTDPKDNDTDNDGLPDGFEVDQGLDPLNNDTDGDGLTDGSEVGAGLNPFSGDSDCDGVPDAIDKDNSIALNEDIVLVADASENLDAFWNGLSTGANVINATSQELTGKYSSKQFVVLAGRPDAANGTSGAMIGNLLAGSGETLEMMMNDTTSHIAVRYGVWTATQTVVMLSRLDPDDYIEVLGIMKSMRMTVQKNSVTAQYISPRSQSSLDNIDSVRATDAVTMSQMNAMATYNITVSTYNSTTAPAALVYSNGLPPGDRIVDKYIGISYAGEPGLMNATYLELYYTAADLDRTGDGDASDVEDINERTLWLYWYDAANGNWTVLSEELDWVDGIGVNTTDFELYGKQYQGLICANVTRAGLFAVGGRAGTTAVPAVSKAGEDVTSYVGDALQFNGSLSTGNGAIANFSWTFQYDNQTITLFGPMPNFTFQIPGTYLITLTVRDSLGFVSNDTFMVTVSEKPIVYWTLRVGPVKDDKGTALEGVVMNLTIGNETFSNTTDSQGFVGFRLGPWHLNRSVQLAFSKQGYEPGSYVTNITQAGILERDPPALQKLTILETFTLTVGPVKDTNGKIIMGVYVTLTVNGTTYHNTTDAQGIARFVLSYSLMGSGVYIVLEKKGYATLRYNTSISLGGGLNQAAPYMSVKAAPVKEGISPMVGVMIAVVVISLVLAALMIMRRKPPTRKDDEPDDAAPPEDASASEPLAVERVAPLEPVTPPERDAPNEEE